MKNLWVWVLLGLAAGPGLAGCVTVGQRFSPDAVEQLQIGQTTRAQVEEWLGAPYRTGRDTGEDTATYLYYRLGLFGDPVMQDLTVRYSPQGIVTSTTYSARLPEGEEPAAGE